MHALLQGKRVVVVGAGGAGRALAFGAAARGAGCVVIANRSKSKAEELAAELAGSQGVATQVGKGGVYPKHVDCW